MATDRGKKMINAYMLVSMEPGDSSNAIEKMRKIENLAKISVVAGEYDIVLRIQVKNLEDLLNATNKIQKIKGVQRTTTQVIEKEVSL